MASNSTIRRAVRLALASGAATTAMVGVAAVAQEAQDASTEVGTIVVTGTRIQRADYEATSPVVTVSFRIVAAVGHSTARHVPQSAAAVGARAVDDFEQPVGKRRCRTGAHQSPWLGRFAHRWCCSTARD